MNNKKFKNNIKKQQQQQPKQQLQQWNDLSQRIQYIQEGIAYNEIINEGHVQINQLSGNQLINLQQQHYQKQISLLEYQNQGLKKEIKLLKKMNRVMASNYQELFQFIQTVDNISLPIQIQRGVQVFQGLVDSQKESQITRYKLMEVKVREEIIIEKQIQIEVPVQIIKQVQVEVIRQIPVQRIKEVYIQVIKEVPVVVKQFIPVQIIKEVEVIKQVIVQVVKQVVVQVVKQVVVQVIKEIEVEIQVPIEVQVIKEVYIQIIKQVPTQVIKQIYIEVIKQIEVPVQIIKQIEIIRQVQKIVEIPIQRIVEVMISNNVPNQHKQFHNNNSQHMKYHNNSNQQRQIHNQNIQSHSSNILNMKLNLLSHHYNRNAIISTIDRLLKQIKNIQLQNKISSLIQQLYLDADYRQRTNLTMQDMVIRYQQLINQLQSHPINHKQQLPNLDERQNEAMLTKLQKQIIKSKRLLIEGDRQKLKLLDELNLSRNYNNNIRLQLQKSNIDEETQCLIQQLTKQLQQQKYKRNVLEEQNRYLKQEIQDIFTQTVQKNIKLEVFNDEKKKKVYK